MDAPASGRWRTGGALFRPGKRLTLHLGVLEQPYDTAGKRSAKVMTTYDVAKILEKNYGVMGMFVQQYEEPIAEYMTESLQGALEAFLMGQAVDPFGRGTQGIERMFREFISTREVERAGFAPYTRISGRRPSLMQIPTKAALRGVNHRLARPYARGNPRRPSFRDTGMYMNSFRAWTD